MLSQHQTSFKNFGETQLGIKLIKIYYAGKRFNLSKRGHQHKVMIFFAAFRAAFLLVSLLWSAVIICSINWRKPNSIQTNQLWRSISIVTNSVQLPDVCISHRLLVQKRIRIPSALSLPFMLTEFEND